MSVLRSGNFGRDGAKPSEPASAPPGPTGAEALIAASRKARAEKTWIVTDGSVGMEAQGIAVAEVVGLPFILKRMRVKGPMRLRRSVPIALAIKRMGHAFGPHIQNPKVPPELFDLVAAPVHDNFEGINVITTFGAVHSVTNARLAEAGKRPARRDSPLRGQARELDLRADQRHRSGHLCHQARASY